ncbi:MAG TPA: DUF4129 domain-containing protein [Candidatus Cybelea sp.]
MIAAVAAAVALATPSREALIERWLDANPSHRPALLEPVGQVARAPSDLQALAQREFAIAGRYRLSEPPPAPPQAQPWWLRALRWLGDRWEQFWDAFFTRVHIGTRGANAAGDAILAIVALALLLAAFFLLRNLQVVRTAKRTAGEPLEPPSDFGALHRHACEAAGRGQYGDAALLLFAATVAMLERSGAVAPKRSATVGELRRQLRTGDAALVAPFDTVATAFTEKAYAERRIEPAQWERARAAFGSLQREVQP